MLPSSSRTCERRVMVQSWSSRDQRPLHAIRPARCVPSETSIFSYVSRDSSSVHWSRPDSSRSETRRSIATSITFGRCISRDSRLSWKSTLVRSGRRASRSSISRSCSMLLSHPLSPSRASRRHLRLNTPCFWRLTRGHTRRLRASFTSSMSPPFGRKPARDEIRTIATEWGLRRVWETTSAAIDDALQDRRSVMAVAHVGSTSPRRAGADRLREPPRALAVQPLGTTGLALEYGKGLTP